MNKEVRNLLFAVVVVIVLIALAILFFSSGIATGKAFSLSIKDSGLDTRVRSTGDESNRIYDIEDPVKTGSYNIEVIEKDDGKIDPEDLIVREQIEGDLESDAPPVIKLPDGSACRENSQCVSDFCIDGVCKTK